MDDQLRCAQQVGQGQAQVSSRVAQSCDDAFGRVVRCRWRLVQTRRAPVAGYYEVRERPAYVNADLQHAALPDTVKQEPRVSIVILKSGDEGPRLFS